MSVSDLKCPKCGKEIIEYDINRWRCIHCSSLFIDRKGKLLDPVQHVSHSWGRNGWEETKKIYDFEPW